MLSLNRHHHLPTVIVAVFRLFFGAINLKQPNRVIYWKLLQISIVPYRLMKDERQLVRRHNQRNEFTIMDRKELQSGVNMDQRSVKALLVWSRVFVSIF